MNQSDQIEHDFSPFIRVYKNGRVERLLGVSSVPASVDPQTGVESKDVVISPETGLSARLYLPKLSDTLQKIPTLVYYHGGGFCIESAFSPTYHRYLNSLVAEANIVAVSVEYRLAPEHRLPIAYDDSWAALQWVASYASGGGPEAWLTDHADFDRLIVSGDSAGANIAHNLAMRAGREGVGHGVKINGAILIHPYFWGSQPVGMEVSFRKEGKPDLWTYLCPSTTGLDDPLVNPVADGAPDLSGLGCTRVLVCVAENDFLKERGWIYYRALESSGWKGTLEMYAVEEEGHVFHLFKPTCENAGLMLKRLAAFFNK
ncbi:probable carboxylesterase 2 [Magnolia sinica]|uniref:probable carboxylesterase 2 n=1 Tax=Magnolia sinica TaxID=86752 RepID=UPI0026595E60|nr:probable carboxylesterase 2 [Magnolia sinica]